MHFKDSYTRIGDEAHSSALLLYAETSKNEKEDPSKLVRDRDSWYNLGNCILVATTQRRSMLHSVLIV